MRPPLFCLVSTAMKWNAKSSLIAAVALMACLLCLPAAAGTAEPAIPLVRVQMGAAMLVAEVPLTGAQKYQGLGGRQGLAPGRGMLFIFDPPFAATMSMRGMRFALDFIWCRAGRVIGITARVPASGKPRMLHPPGKVDMVLEAPAGWASKNGVITGDPVTVSPLSQPAPQALERLLGGLAVTDTATE